MSQEVTSALNLSQKCMYTPIFTLAATRACTDKCLYVFRDAVLERKIRCVKERVNEIKRNVKKKKWNGIKVDVNYGLGVSKIFMNKII